MAIQIAGEGWIGDLYDWFPAPQWMQVYDNRTFEQTPALPTVAPESVAKAEICFRLPDGWSVCTVPGIWAQSYRNKGYPEIPASAPEFVPPSSPESTGSYRDVVVPSDAKEEIPGDEATVAIDWGALANTAIEAAFRPAFQGGVASGPSYQGLAAPAPAVATPAAMDGGGCGCNKSPCVCGVDSCGRPALIDPRTGKRCYKRRRRRLLTDRDFDDLMRISTLPNSKNVTTVLAKAIGRR